MERAVAASRLPQASRNRTAESSISARLSAREGSFPPPHPVPCKKSARQSRKAARAAEYEPHTLELLAKSLPPSEKIIPDPGDTTIPARPV
jgi:hypothetical protein